MCYINYILHEMKGEKNMSDTNFGFGATPACGFGGMEVPTGGSGSAKPNNGNVNSKPGYGKPGFGSRPW